MLLSGAKKLKEIVFNEGLEYIDYFAFASCKLKKIMIPSSVKYISISVCLLL